MIFISDHGDSTKGISAAVFMYTFDGAYIGYMDGGEFQFYRPRGLAYDQEKLYVTDALAGEITVIDVAAMTRSGALGEYGSEPGQLVQPQDVFVDPERMEIFVANKRLGRIEKIAFGGTVQ